jgi:hypothetical protein
MSKVAPAWFSNRAPVLSYSGLLPLQLALRHNAALPKQSPVLWIVYSGCFSLLLSEGPIELGTIQHDDLPALDGDQSLSTQLPQHTIKCLACHAGQTGELILRQADIDASPRIAEAEKRCARSRSDRVTRCQAGRCANSSAVVVLARSRTTNSASRVSVIAG